MSDSATPAAGGDALKRVYVELAARLVDQRPVASDDAIRVVEIPATGEFVGMQGSEDDLRALLVFEPEHRWPPERAAESVSRFRRITGMHRVATAMAIEAELVGIDAARKANEQQMEEARQRNADLEKQAAALSAQLAEIMATAEPAPKRARGGGIDE